ncbi:transcriptional regulator, GntR family / AMINOTRANSFERASE CLASS-I domain protein [Burkholderia pseudomallei]|nr:transcriptional regulator, GntR family / AMINOTRANSFERASE CLASS-I domain protein [Burkholderia pseudomallei]
MDYGVLLSNFERDTARDALARASQQHRLYACLRAAILNGTLEAGTYLMSSRARSPRRCESRATRCSTPTSGSPPRASSSRGGKARWSRV